MNVRIKISYFLFLFLGLTGLTSTPAIAADSIFLCGDALEGETLNPRYPGCIDVLAWSWGATSPGGSGAANFQTVSVTKNVDKSSPSIMLHLAKGEHIAKLELFVDNCTSECANSAYYKVIIENILISSVSLGESAGDDRPTENILLNYQKVQWCYSAVNPEGGLDAEVCNGWDLQKNAPL